MLCGKYHHCRRYYDNGSQYFWPKYNIIDKIYWIEIFSQATYNVIMVIIFSYQVMKDVSLMQMNCNECLKLSSLYLGEILCGHIDESIQYVQKDLVSGAHDLLVRTCVGQSYLSISCPDKLNTKDPNLHAVILSNGYIVQDSQDIANTTYLSWVGIKKFNELKVGIFNGGPSILDDYVD